MDISQIKAVIFDCDGVMFDTALANRKYYDEVLATFSKAPLNEEQFINVHMMTVKDAIGYLFPEKTELTDVFSCLKNIGYHKFIKYMKMEDGLVDLLESYFEVVVTAATMKKPKPDPEQLHLIMSQFNLKPGQILFVGDSDYDRLAAVNAGVRFVAFKAPKLEADWNVDSMDEIAGILQINS